MLSVTPGALGVTPSAATLIYFYTAVQSRVIVVRRVPTPGTIDKQALWDNYFTAAPPRRRRLVARSVTVKRA